MSKVQIELGQWTRLLLGISALIIMWGAPGEIAAKSAGADSWEDETSFAALQLRSIRIHDLVATRAVSCAGIPLVLVEL